MEIVTDQCWIEITKNFGSTDNPKYFCILHAPKNEEPTCSKEWPIEKRGEQQASFLLNLINEWNETNLIRKENSQLPISLTLVGVNSGSLVFPDKYIFTGDIVLARAEFKGKVSLKSAIFLETAIFEETIFFEDAFFNKTEFHSGASFIHAQFGKSSEFSDAKFNNALFYAAKFGQGIKADSRNEYQYLYSTKFDDAKFDGQAHFDFAEFAGDAIFARVSFGKTAEFTKSKFYQSALFSNAIFVSKAIFKKTEFFENVYFDYAEFNEEADFSNITSHKTAGYTLFDYAKFKQGEAIFNGSDFFGETHFKKTTFCNYVSFRDVDFRGNANFLDVSFEGWVLFVLTRVHAFFNCLHWHVSKPSQFINCSINRLSYSTHSGEILTLNECKIPVSGYWEFAFADCSRLRFINIRDMSKLDFIGANIRNTIFESCYWERDSKNHYAKLYNHDAMLSVGNQTMHQLRSLYQQLKINLEDNRDFIQSGHFHYQEMALRQHDAVTQGIGWERVILYLYHVLGDFGESYKKLFMSMVFSIFLTTYLVTILEGLLGYNKNKVISEIFFSLTENFKNVLLVLIPSSFQQNTDLKLCWQSKLILGFEGLILLSLTTLFVMAIRRHFRR